MLAAAVLGAGLLAASGACRAQAVGADFLGERASAEARYAAGWAISSGDHQGRPFAVVDKKDARLFVFAPDGRLVGATPVLLGLARGDDAAPGTADRPAHALRREERTTPAGRFATEPGHNDKGEAIVWLDYDASLALHRLRPAPAAERRVERMASADAADHRISFGCVVVPPPFYERVIAPTLGQRRGVVYVLPETRPAREMFAAIDAAADAQ
jgi:hypothetical protein